GGAGSPRRGRRGPREALEGCGARGARRGPPQGDAADRRSREVDGRALGKGPEGRGSGRARGAAETGGAAFEAEPRLAREEPDAAPRGPADAPRLAPPAREGLRLPPDPGRTARRGPAVKVLETDRLELRRLTPGDSAFILELLNDEAWLRYIGDKGVRNLADARRYLETGPIEMYERLGF